MPELLKDIGLVVLGAILGFAAERLAEHYKQRKRKREVLRRLDRMLTNVKHAVAHGHDFTNKAHWYGELDALANVDRDWLDQLYEPLKRIAWRIRDQSFDHAKSDAVDYCCDELILDLALFQLTLLPLIRMKSELRQATQKRLAREAVLCWHGILDGDAAEQVERFVKHWHEGKVTVDKKFAMSSVLGREEETPKA
jgi:hypothetical protein